MTDHLESYRRMARSIRFFPPASLAQPSQQSQAEPGTPASVDLASKKTTLDTEITAVSMPPIDPSAHVTALVQEAVQKPTALPITYTILENIGDRISRLTTAKAAPITLQPKIPQPTDDSVSLVDLASNSVIDPNHAATLIHEAVRQPTSLPERYEIRENIGDRISRLSAGKPVDSDSTSAKIPQLDEHTPSARSIEPNSSEAGVKKSVANTDLEAATSDTGVGEAPAIAQNHSDDANTQSKPAAATTDAANVETPSHTEPVAATDTLVAPPETTPPTLLERVSSVIETVSTAFKNSDIKQQDSPKTTPSSSESVPANTPTTDTVVDANDSPPEPAPSLIERVSSVVEAVTTAFKHPDTQHQDLDTPEPSQPTEVISQTPTPPPTISPASPIQAETTPLKDLEVLGKASDNETIEQTSLNSDAIDTDEQPTNQAAPTKTTTVKGSGSDTDTSNRTSSTKRSSKKKTRGKGFGS